MVFSVLLFVFISASVLPSNMDFEEFGQEDSLAYTTGWELDGLLCRPDSSAVKGGALSGLIAADSVGEGFILQSFPLEYTGETLVFSGWYMGSNTGQAAVWIAASDAAGNVLEYDDNDLSFDEDSIWSEFSLSIPTGGFSDSLEIGIWFAGEDTLRLDEFSLLLDGVPLSEAPPREPFGAVLDREYDSGSGVVFGVLTDFQKESLVQLGKVWAFLKYHHPAVCAGELNWDYELFRVLPAVLEASDEPAREAALMQLLPSFEPLPPAEIPGQEGVPFMEADHSWIEGDETGNSLAFLLQAVLEGRHTGESYYLRNGYMPFLYEREYSDMDFSDDGYRLLGLYRFWGFVEYWFPYRYATDTLWSEQLALSLPDFIEAENSLEYQLALRRLAHSVGDGHCGIYGTTEEIDSLLGDMYLPVELDLIEGRWVTTGFMHPSILESPLRLGDVILSVDGADLTARGEYLYSLSRGSTQASRYHRTGGDVRRGFGDTAEILLERGGQQFQLTLPMVPRDSLDRSMLPEPFPGQESFLITEDGFGFIDLAGLQREDVDILKLEFRGLPGLIIDMRGYPSDFPIYEMGRFLLPDSIPFSIISSSHWNHPGSFTLTDTLYAGGGGVLSFGGPVAILVDRGSVSSTEFHAMAWRLAPECRVFGEPTAGADGNLNTFVLPGGYRSGFSGIGIYNPDGSETQRVGILPDTLVTPTIHGLQEGRDEIYEAGVNWLRGRISSG